MAPDVHLVLWSSRKDDVWYATVQI